MRLVMTDLEVELGQDFYKVCSFLCTSLEATQGQVRESGEHVQLKTKRV